MMLVTLEKARAHCRVDNTADDTDLTLKIMGASAAVVTYLKAPSFTDSSGTIPVDSAGVALDVPEDIQIATLMLIADFYKNREPTADDAVDAQAGYGYLPRAVVALLYAYRVPTIGAPTPSTRRWPWWFRDGCC